MIPSFHKLRAASAHPNAAAPPPLQETTTAEIFRRRLELKNQREELDRFTRAHRFESCAQLGLPYTPAARWLAEHFHPLQVRTATGKVLLIWQELLLARVYPPEIATATILRNPWSL